uniref:Uncharacterized protein n=1 Tax=Arundo donax TaxID=35708 RepID=A0A0A8ZVJ7_ARUDO
MIQTKAGDDMTCSELLS